MHLLIQGIIHLDGNLICDAGKGVVHCEVDLAVLLPDIHAGRTIQKVRLSIGGILRQFVHQPRISLGIGIGKTDDAVRCLQGFLGGNVRIIGEETDFLGVVIGPIFDGTVGPIVAPDESHLLVVHEIRGHAGEVILYVTGVAGKNAN